MELEKWVELLSRRSSATARTYVERLLAFCKFAEVTPEEMLSLPEKRLNELVAEYASVKTPSVVSLTVAAIKNWFRANGKRFDAYVVVPRGEKEPVVVPSAEDVAKAVFYAPLKVKVAIAFLAFTGVRPSVLATVDGKNGLKVKHLPEVTPGEKLPRKPLVVKVPEYLSKVSWPYVTFFPGSMTPLLERWFEEREIRSEEDRLFPSTKRKSLSAGVRKALRFAGLKCPPYALRSYFRTRLAEAEMEGIVPATHVEYWMGHTNVAIRYSFAKGVPERILEKMRVRYGECEKFLVHESLKRIV